MKPSLETLFAPADLRSLPRAPLHIVMAARMCALCHAAGRDPRTVLATRLPGPEAVDAVLDLVGAAGNAWTDPFSANRPCSFVMSPDEAALAALAAAAGRDDPRGADAALADLLPRSARAELYRLARRAVASLVIREVGGA